MRKVSEEKFSDFFQQNYTFVKVDPSRFVIFFRKAPIPLPKDSNGYIKQFYAVLDKKGGLMNPENDSLVKTKLVIKSFTVKENCQISSLA